MKQLTKISQFNVASKLLFLLLVVIINTATISAQEPYLKFDLVSKYTNFPYVVAITAFENKVWIGSSEGLWQINEPKDSAAMYANIYTIDTISLEKVDLKDSILVKKEHPKKFVYSIAVKDTNEVWVGDIDGYVYQVKGKEVAFNKRVSTQPLRNISWVDSTKTKLLLIYPSTYGDSKTANEHNIYTLDIDTKKVEKDTLLNKNHSRKEATKVFLEALATNNKDEIYLATNIGLVAYNTKTKKHEKISNDNSYKVTVNRETKEVYALSIKGNQTYFVAYSLTNFKELRSFILPPTNNKERMRVMYLDNLGYIWLASNSANIIYFKATEQNSDLLLLSNAAKISALTTNNTIVSVTDIVQTKDSSIWITTGAGLCRYGIKKIAPIIKVEKKDSIVAEKYTVANLSFGISDTIINREAHDDLNMMVKKINRDTSLLIRINGHTDMPIFADKATPADSTKAWADMQLLSEARARAVFTYLKNKGVSEKRMEVKGYGASQPLNTPTEPVIKNQAVTHSPNRRVEIEFIKTTN
jgi:outer membrane protein OmpA-like peptidoglycan-associated protein